VSAKTGMRIAASTDNRVAWLRLNSSWQQTTRLKTLGAQVPRGTVPTPEQTSVPFFNSSEEGNPGASTAVKAGLPESTRKRPAWFDVRVRVAAAVLVCSTITLAWYLIPRGPSYETAVGVLQAVPLADGSRVTLNTNTHINVHLTTNEREVNLTQGEAYFEVAKDSTRPFVVMAGDKRVVAVGTQFSVRRDGEDVRVFVTEGKVEVEGVAATGSNTVQHATQLDAGSIAHASADGLVVQKKPLAEVEQFLSWRSGYLAFDRTPLAAAAAEFNRYSKRQIVIEDPAVAAILVGGNFRATNVEAFVRLIESDFPIAATVEPDRIILTGVPAPAPQLQK